MIDRRIFLKSSALALAGSAVMPNVFVRMANASNTKGKKVLVVVFQRGAVDGLNVVVPYGEQAYYASRPSIALARPGAAEGAVIDLDGFFGLNPALAPLLPYFKEHSAAFIQATGSPDASRSHFDAQDFMESGTPGVKITQDGFLSRAMSSRKPAQPTPLRAVALSSSLPRILAGDRGGAVAIANVSQFGIRGGAQAQPIAASFESMYGGTAFDAVRVLKAANVGDRKIENGATYPPGAFGESLRQIAQLIKSDVGLEVAFADVEGWDTHAGQGGATGRLTQQLRQFGAAIAAFAQDLGSRMSDVVLVTTSEFGRTVKENGNRGTDHGHANVMMVLGGGVKGGKVYGEWPGLATEQLFERRDLAVTTDFRDVFGELLVKQLAVTDLKSVFPGYASSREKFRG
jgi:uncharacterized protein (DUF1501 family)